jgi:activator of 2-hydroxyglutaryl-CoA dehydratase
VRQRGLEQVNTERAEDYVKKEIEEAATAIRSSAYYQVKDAGAPGYGEQIVVRIDDLEKTLTSLWKAARKK